MCLRNPKCCVYYITTSHRPLITPLNTIASKHQTSTPKTHDHGHQDSYSGSRSPSHRYAGDRQSSRRNVDNRCFLFFSYFFASLGGLLALLFKRERQKEGGRDNLAVRPTLICFFNCQFDPVRYRLFRSMQTSCQSVNALVYIPDFEVTKPLRPPACLLPGLEQTSWTQGCV